MFLFLYFLGIFDLPTLDVLILKCSYKKLCKGTVMDKMITSRLVSALISWIMNRNPRSISSHDRISLCGGG